MAATGNIATLKLNPANKKWEAIFQNVVIASSLNKEYVKMVINGGNCNRALKYGVTGVVDSSEMVVEGTHGAAIVEQPLDKFSINERFDFLESFVAGVGKRRYKSVILTGEGGLGKSFSVHKALKEKANLICADDEYTKQRGQLKDGADEDSDNDDDYEMIDVIGVGTDSQLTLSESRKYYSVVKGFSTAKGLYEILYHNRNRTVVFDDCDSILKDPVALNLLKGALDSYDRRVISWRSKGFIDDGLPTSFEFTGGVIFISNKHMSQIDQAVRTRAICIDLSMNLDQKLERMEAIVEAGEFLPDYDDKIKKTALAFLKEHAHTAGEISLRTLIQVTLIAEEGNIGKTKWERRAEYFLLNA